MVQNLMTNTPPRDAFNNAVQAINARITLTAADTPKVKIGTIPAGAIVLAIYSRVATAVTGGTPVIGIGSVTAGGAVPSVGGTGNVQTTMAEAAGSEQVFPLAAFAQPLTADTDFYVGTSGARHGRRCLCDHRVREAASRDHAHLARRAGLRRGGNPSLCLHVERRLFTAGDKVEVADPWMIAKARGNRFFRVEERQRQSAAGNVDQR